MINSNEFLIYLSILITQLEETNSIVLCLWNLWWIEDRFRYRVVKESSGFQSVDGFLKVLPIVDQQIAMLMMLAHL